MAETNPIKFLLNQGEAAEAAAAVDAPAFSLTKVLALGAIVVTPIATAVAEKVNQGGLEANHLVALGIALLLFLAVTAAADVLARAIATSAEKNAQAAQASIAQLNHFKSPLPGTRIIADPNKPDPVVEVLAAAQGDVAYFLVKEGDTLSWQPASTINIAPATI